MGIERSRQAIADADVVLVVTDAAHADVGDAHLLEATAQRPRVVVANKADLVPGTKYQVPSSLSAGNGTQAAILKTSAVTGEGIAELRTQIVDWDHNWSEPTAPMTVLADPQANRYVAGVAWHCYEGHVQVQAAVHDAFPDKDTWFTECSGGEWKPAWSETLPWMVRHLVIGATRGWARGVLMWNLALDENHGPHKGGCNDCRGIVTIDSRTGAVTRNLEYYALAHASKFVLPGARRIDSTAAAGPLESVAFVNADGSIVLVVVNGADQPQAFAVRWDGRSLGYTLPASSVVTLVWKG